MSEFPPVGTRIADVKGIVWIVVESRGHYGTVRAGPLTRTMRAERLAEWKIEG